MLNDPYIILELNRKASDEDVRKTYLKAIQLCPPEKDADGFQRIKVAYDAVKTKQQRIEFDLFNYETPSLEDIVGQAASRSSGTTRRPSLSTIQALLVPTIK